MKKTPYEIYLETFAKVQTGKVLDDYDFGYPTADGYVPFDDKEKLAVAMASEDVKIKSPLKSKTNFQEVLKKLSE